MSSDRKVFGIQEIRDTGSAVSASATRSQDDFTTLRARLQDLAPSFQGATAQAFEARFEEWQSSAAQLTTALDELGRFLDNAATQIEDTDQAIAGSLR